MAYEEDNLNLKILQTFEEQCFSPFMAENPLPENSDEETNYLQ